MKYRLLRIAVFALLLPAGLSVSCKDDDVETPSQPSAIQGNYRVDSTVIQTYSMRMVTSESGYLLDFKSSGTLDTYRFFSKDRSIPYYFSNSVLTADIDTTDTGVELYDFVKNQDSICLTKQDTIIHRFYLSQL